MRMVIVMNWVMDLGGCKVKTLGALGGVKVRVSLRASVALDRVNVIV